MGNNVDPFILSLLDSHDMGNLGQDQALDINARKKLARYLDEYVESKELVLKARFVNSDHVHVLFELPTKLSIENVAQLLKGSSSHWINENRLCKGRFALQRGYGVFSVSHSLVERVSRYIVEQDAHHHKSTFQEEYRKFVEACGLVWHDDLE